MMRIRGRARSTSPGAFVAAAPVVVGVVFGAAFGACSAKQPERTTYFEQTIAPVLTTSCVRTNTGAACHVADPKGNAFGNLDVSTFDGVNHRRDLLVNYGPYGQPSLLLKNIPPFTLQVQAYDGENVDVTTDIKHTGLTILDPTAGGYQTVRRWIENGATENNGGAPPAAIPRQPCSGTVPAAEGFDPAQDPGTADFGTFVQQVNPTFQNTCAAGNCHGTAANELYLTCGVTPEQLRWNYFAAGQYLATNPEQSEIVRRPLAAAQGGSFHEGGDIFTSTADEGYQGLLGWAKAHGPPVVPPQDPAFLFFAHRVQPMLVKKGCMMIQCHSAAMFHDYRLRGGSGGSFSFAATQKNYALSLEQLALESDDVGKSRLVQKNLFRPEVYADGVGLAHRGGPLLEDFPGETANGAACDALGLDPTTGPIDQVKAYCVMREWHRLERLARGLGPVSALAYVKRTIPRGPDRAQDFDVYAPGAELHVADLQVAPDGTLSTSNDRVLNAGCGFPAGAADIRRPQASWDGKTLAFAARTGGGEGLRVYTVGVDGKGCAREPTVSAGVAAEVHDFDPVWSPRDAAGVSRLVFASTRGNLDAATYDYQGPQRTPADPTKPNANLYVMEPDPSGQGSRIRQLSYLLNLERYPSFMNDGRLIFDTEKRAPGFRQLALRRMNLDGGDYHPLYAQRGSIGYPEARQGVELADKNFVAIFSDADAPHGGGTLGVINRSLGVDFTSQDPADYPIDSSVIDPSAAASPEPNFFLHSLSFPDRAVSGHAGAATAGVYAAPTPLPDGRVVVSFGGASDPSTFGGDYDLYVFDPRTGAKQKLLGDAGVAETDAVAVYPRASRGVFSSRLDEPNGFSIPLAGHTETDLTVLDLPVLASLLFQNTPTGRTLEDLPYVDVYEDLPPEAGVTSFDQGGANVVSDAFGKVYVRRRLLGRVPTAADGSAHVRLPGGVPLVLRLPDTDLSRKYGWPRVQREEMSFAPGEVVHQGFRREFFSGLCGNCHGAVSGRPLDTAVRPDILTQASMTLSQGGAATDLNFSGSARGALATEGAPASP